jgi:hypothetical protein
VPKIDIHQYVYVRGRKGEQKFFPAGTEVTEAIGAEAMSDRRSFESTAPATGKVLGTIVKFRQLGTFSG